MSLKSLQEDINNIIIGMSNISIHTENVNNVIPLEIQAKKRSEESFWCMNRHYNEYKLYQVRLKNDKTDLKLNINTYFLYNKQYPMSNEDVFEFIQNFNKIIYEKEKVFYINLKIMYDNGTQTQTFQELYNFILCQLEYLVKYNSQDVYLLVS